MPRGRGRTTIEVSLETRDMLRDVSRSVGKAYDEVIKTLLEVCKSLLSYRAEYDDLLGDVKLSCEDKEVYIDAKEYRKLRKIIKILPKPTEGSYTLSTLERLLLIE